MFIEKNEVAFFKKHRVDPPLNLLVFFFFFLFFFSFLPSLIGGRQPREDPPRHLLVASPYVGVPHVVYTVYCTAYIYIDSECKDLSFCKA